MLHRLYGVMLALVFAPLCAATTLRVCVDDRPFPPLTFPDREGQAQYLIRQAASQQDWRVVFISVPRLRCLAGIASGKYDATVAPATVSLRHDMVIPERDALPDQQRALGTVRVLAFRPQGSLASWDGQRFRGLHKPVFYGAGVVTIQDRLAALGVQGDASAKTLPQIINMLLLGRGQIALGTEYALFEALEEGGFEARIEVLPAPFLQADCFLSVGKAFHVANQPAIEAIWTTIGELRASAQWRELAPLLAR